MPRALLLVSTIFFIAACGSKKTESDFGTLLEEAIIIEISPEKVKSLLESEEYLESMSDEDYRILVDASGELELRPYRNIMSLNQVRSADNIVIILLMNNFNIEYKDRGYVTPLHAAASAGRGGAVYMLLRSGENPNEINEFGDSPLMSAAYKCSLASMLILLDYGADPGIRNNSGQSVYDIANLSGCDVASNVINNYIDGSPIDMEIIKKNKSHAN